MSRQRDLTQYTPGNLSDKATQFNPYTPSAGYCQGHADTVEQMVLGLAFPIWRNRLDNVHMGVLQPGEVKKGETQKIVDMPFLQAFAQQLEIEIKAPSVDGKAGEIKQPIQHPHPSADKDQIKATLALDQLLKKLGCREYKQSFFQEQSVQAVQTFPADELKSQVDFANAICSAYQQKKLNESKLPLDERRILVADEMATFHKTYPFIQQLQEIGIYLSSMAIYQTGEFALLKTPRTQMDTRKKNLLAPVDLDEKKQNVESTQSGVINLPSIGGKANHQQLMDYFAGLEKIFLQLPRQFDDLLPLCIQIFVTDHTIPICYHLNEETWYLLDIHFQPYRACNLQELASLILTLGLPAYFKSFDIGTVNTLISLGYHPQEKSWVLMEAQTTDEKFTPLVKKLKEAREEKVIQHDLNTATMELSVELSINTRHMRSSVQEITTWHSSLRFSPVSPEVERNSLFYAVRFNQLDRIKTLLASGHEIKLECLAAAIYKNHVSALTLLLDAKADLNTKLPSGKSLLEYAIEFGNAEMMILLLERGAITTSSVWPVYTALDPAFPLENSYVAYLIKLSQHDNLLADLEKYHAACIQQAIDHHIQNFIKQNHYRAQLFQGVEYKAEQHLSAETARLRFIALKHIDAVIRNSLKNILQHQADSPEKMMPAIQRIFDLFAGDYQKALAIQTTAEYELFKQHITRASRVAKNTLNAQPIQVQPRANSEQKEPETKPVAPRVNPLPLNTPRSGRYMLGGTFGSVGGTLALAALIIVAVVTNPVGAAIVGFVAGCLGAAALIGAGYYALKIAYRRIMVENILSRFKTQPVLHNDLIIQDKKLLAEGRLSTEVCLLLLSAGQLIQKAKQPSSSPHKRKQPTPEVAYSLQDRPTQQIVVTASGSFWRESGSDSLYAISRNSKTFSQQCNKNIPLF